MTDKKKCLKPSKRKIKEMNRQLSDKQNEIAQKDKFWLKPPSQKEKKILDNKERTKMLEEAEAERQRRDRMEEARIVAQRYNCAISITGL